MNELRVFSVFSFFFFDQRVFSVKAWECCFGQNDGGAHNGDHIDVQIRAFQVVVA